uniref:Nodulation protein nolG n=1 Tax=Lygus hesperus TaxID=30085 RepID=A0A0A9XV52_LYGHE
MVECLADSLPVSTKLLHHGTPVSIANSFVAPVSQSTVVPSEQPQSINLFDKIFSNVQRQSIGVDPATTTAVVITPTKLDAPNFDFTFGFNTTVGGDSPPL